MEVINEEDILTHEEEVGKRIGKLCNQKSKAYGDSISSSAIIMRELYPDGIPTESYLDALLVVRIIDKLKRIATDKHAFNEDPWSDIVGYAIRRVVLQELETEIERACTDLT